MHALQRGPQRDRVISCNAIRRLQLQECCTGCQKHLPKRNPPIASNKLQEKMRRGASSVQHILPHYAINCQSHRLLCWQSTHEPLCTLANNPPPHGMWHECFTSVTRELTTLFFNRTNRQGPASCRIGEVQALRDHTDNSLLQRFFFMA